ncbi:uncharacterized protein BO80DRAFT_424783 [Aspergillus ibericus CBS 121593]|uniref:Uncharacterized protein n=1 Tax=Aspergillus ibericus CBS 121593 TaxID=1448316 RepID=A0A395H081_9EURO|nr:hypothetical protein BO80DRAFT_424783 [Aspergillus ibericus CBS 121593]RAL01206.1 hypothetical protein BO80DRAFT_424783 [Aspergillus ibericus CBS 121593]
MPRSGKDFSYKDSGTNGAPATTLAALTQTPTTTQTVTGPTITPTPMGALITITAMVARLIPLLVGRNRRDLTGC